MTAEYVALTQLEREAAQLWATAKVVQQKIDALKARPDAVVPQHAALAASDAIMRSRHSALDAAGLLDAALTACEVTR